MATPYSTDAQGWPLFEALEPRLLLNGTVEGLVWDDLEDNGRQVVGEPATISAAATPGVTDGGGDVAAGPVDTDLEAPLAAAAQVQSLGVFEVWHIVHKDGVDYEIQIDADVPLNDLSLPRSLWKSGELNGIRVSPRPNDAATMKDLVYAAQTARLFREGTGVSYYVGIAPGQRVLTQRVDWNDNAYDLHVIPGLGDYAPLVGGWVGVIPFDGLDNYANRKAHYRAYLEEVILQPDRYEALRKEGKLVELLGEFLELPGDVSGGVGDFQLVADALRQLTSSGVASSGAKIASSVLQDSRFWDVWRKGRSHFGEDVLDQLQFELGALDFGLELVEVPLDFAQRLLIQSLIGLDPQGDRLDALSRFLDSSRNVDPALREAFLDVQQDFEIIKRDFGASVAFALQYAIDDNATDILVSGIDFAAKAVEFYASSGVAVSLAKAAGFGLVLGGQVLDLLADLDTVNNATIAGTVDWYMAEYLDELHAGGDFDGVLQYRDAKTVTAIHSMRTYSGHIFYDSLASFSSASLLDYINPYTWIKTVGFIVMGFGGGYTQQEFVNQCNEYSDDRLLYPNTDGSPTELVTNRYYSNSADQYDWLSEAVSLPDFSVNTTGVSVTPDSLPSPGSTISVNVSVDNLATTGGTASVEAVFIAAAGGHTFSASAPAQWIDPGASTEFVLVADSTGATPGSYSLVVTTREANDGLDFNQDNNSVELGYTIVGGDPLWLGPFPILTVEQSRPGEEYFAMLDLSSFYYAEPSESISILAAGYANLVVDIDDQNVATIRGNYGWLGAEEVAFVLRDSSGKTSTQSAYVTVLQEDGTLYGQLTDGAVMPASGTAGTVFTYSIAYSHPNGVFPKKRHIYINGTPRAMTWDGNPISNGASFTYTILGQELLGEENTFWFEFSDGDRTYRYPNGGLLPGPDIDVRHDVAVLNASIDPTDPSPGQNVAVAARVVNVGTMLEDSVTVNFIVNGVIQESRTVEELWLGEESSSLDFAWSVPVSDFVEDYTIRVEAIPVSGETAIDDNIFEWMLTVAPMPGAISGWVFDGDNIPVAGATVKVMDSDVDSYGSTDTDGYFFLDGLMPGAYSLEASAATEGTSIRSNVQVHAQQTTVLPANFILSSASMDLITTGPSLRRTAWSPDGSQLAFTTRYYDAATGEQLHLHVINEDRTGLRSLTGPDKPIVHVDSRGIFWSPDNYIYFIGETASSGVKVWRVSAAGDGSDASMVLGTSLYGMAVSWDGNWLAYTDASDRQIYRVHVNGGSVTKLTDGPKLHERLAWSRDGSKLAFTDNFGKLFLLDPGDLSQIGDETETLIWPSAISSMEWLPGDESIIFSTGQDIWIHYLVTGENVRLLYFPEIDRDPSVTRDGPPKMAFVSKKGIAGPQDYGLYVMPLSVPSLHFTDVTAQPDPFTPNGDGVNDELTISYTTNRDAYVTVKVHDSQGNHVRTLLDNVFQPGGDHAVVWDGTDSRGNRENAEVYFYRLDMNDGSEVAPSAHGRVTMLKAILALWTRFDYAQWSPDGTKIVYYDTDNDNDGATGTMYVCNADGSNRQEIPTPYGVDRRPTWSADGQMIIFPSLSGVPGRPEIAAMNLDGSGYVELTTSASASFLGGTYPSVSPDGTQIVLIGLWKEQQGGDYFWRITLMNADGSDLHTLGTHKRRAGIDNGIGPTWSSDGQWIIYAADKDDDDNMEIYRIAANGSAEEALTNNPYSHQYPEFSPDDLRLLFSSNRSGAGYDLWAAMLDGSAAPRALAEGYGYGSLSPTGDQILVSGHVLDLFMPLTKGAVAGRIVDANTLAPLPEVIVSVSLAGALVGTTSTNAQGGYQLGDLEPGQYTISAARQGYFTSSEIVVDTYAWVVSRDNDLMLDPLPSVAITSLHDGDTIGSTVAIHAVGVAGDVSQVKYQYRPVGGDWTDIATTIFPLPAELVTDGFPSGNYQVRAVGMDEIGNEDDVPTIVNFSIDHTAPIATIPGPASRIMLNGTISLTASCDVPDVASVIFQYRPVGEVLWTRIGQVITQGPWVSTWDASHLFSGDYEVRAMAVDELGNIDGDAQPIIFHLFTTAMGDMDLDGDVDSFDIDALSGNFGGPGNVNPLYDLDGDGDADAYDMDIMVHDLVETTIGIGTEYGDFNLDGLVELGDLTILGTYYGVGTTWAEGDANGDQIVELGDLTILGTYYGFDASADTIGASSDTGSAAMAEGPLPTQGEDGPQGAPLSLATSASAGLGTGLDEWVGPADAATLSSSIPIGLAEPGSAGLVELVAITDEDVSLGGVGRGSHVGSADADVNLMVWPTWSQGVEDRPAASHTPPPMIAGGRSVRARPLTLPHRQAGSRRLSVTVPALAGTDMLSDAPRRSRTVRPEPSHPDLQAVLVNILDETTLLAGLFPED